MTKRKYVIIAAAAILALAVGLAALNFNKIISLLRPGFMEVNLSSLTPDDNKTLDSLRKIDDHPLYVMDFYSDDSRFLEIKDKYYWALGLPKPKCSTFAIKNADGVSLFGRNNDNLECPVLLIYNHPKDGYASVGVADIGGFGFDMGNKTPLDSREVSTRLLYAPYAIGDGMNEWGLTIGDMSVHTDSKIVIDPNKETKSNGEMRYYILSHAKNTEEAVQILEKYNIKFPGELEHFLISDPSGNSVLIEWPNGKMQVIRSDKPYLAATNFTISGAEETIEKNQNEYETTGKIAADTPGKKFWRYFTLTDNLSKMYGTTINSGDAMSLLSKVSLIKAKDMDWPTQWSVVYNMNTGEINIAMGRDYENIHTFWLEMKKH